MSHRSAVVIVLLCLISSAAAQDQGKSSSPAALPAPTTDASAKISDFAWLQGRWTGSLGDAQVEQYFSPVTGGVIVGLFRLIAPQQPPLIEFSALRETPDGVELRVRHFDPDLKPMEGMDPIVLKLAKHDSSRFVFENPVNAMPKRSILERKGETLFHARSEIIRENGAPSTIEVDWHRQSLELPGPPAERTAGGTFDRNSLPELAWFTGHWVSTFGKGEVHEFWLAPAGNVMAGLLCPVAGGKAEGYEFSTLAPGTDAAVGRTWQVELDMKIPQDAHMIEAPIAGGTAQSIEFRGMVGKNPFTERVEQIGDDKMHKRLEILKPDGSTLQVIELNATRQAPLL